jgi:urease accessory protein
LIVQWRSEPPKARTALPRFWWIVGSVNVDPLAPAAGLDAARQGGMLRAPFGERRVSQPQAIRRLQRTQGAAHLSFDISGGISSVRRWREEGATKVRLPRRPPDAPAEAILINTAGGLTGGDSIGWIFDVDGASLIATTQAAEKIYRSLGDDAEIRTRLTATSGAQIYWLPQEAILFDGARLRRVLDVDLTGGATLLALEATVFGRRAMGESIHDLAFHDRWRVRRDGKLIFADDIRFDGALPHTAATLGEAGAMATLLLAAADAESHLDKLREVFGADGAVSAWDGKLLARVLAKDGFALRKLLNPALKLLVPGGALPMIWSS